MLISRMADSWCETYGDQDGCSLDLSSFNLYHANSWIIKPATEGFHEHGCSMVEIMAVKVQIPSWFVSHAWIEPRSFQAVLFHVSFLFFVKDSL